MMNKGTLTIGFAAAQLFAVHAFAQDGGKTAPPPPAKSVAADEKAGAKANRKAEGAQATRTTRSGETSAVTPPAPAGMTSPREKATAEAQRKAEGAKAVKTTPGGELGPTK